MSTIRNGWLAMLTAHHRAKRAAHRPSPRQRPGSFSVEQAMERLRNPPSGNWLDCGPA